MELSKRLQAVADMIPPQAAVADIGTDHAYIPIYLTEHRLARRVVAMDVGKGPLERAREHVRQYGYEDRIELRLSDGLEQLKPGEADTMVAAGMGGPLMIRILEQGRDRVKELKTCILQPQSQMAEVRKYLEERQMQVTKEDMVEEDGKFYPILKVEHGKESSLSPLELQYGRRLLAGRHPALKRFLEREYRIKTEIRRGLLKEKESARAKKRLACLEEEIELVVQALSCYGVDV
ncbi:tRNA (adenine(22)-N(1))-methyltransferase [Suipraeoptans intestinalis]|uniref:tRNA (adenine(22)-N(1))-methyltransferase n=1 Tax=Suipraeoptans intestinalis TaxID=2606628 RepID=UPI0023F4DE65|nr:class I SAM-dependent methyltransferase [Suipraeoptans intestinalis]MDD7770176.1 class I SAM-dependent methyltransferase [Suipraeoptans intestinalis]